MEITQFATVNGRDCGPYIPMRNSVTVAAQMEKDSFDYAQKTLSGKISQLFLLTRV